MKKTSSDTITLLYPRGSCLFSRLNRALFKSQFPLIFPNFFSRTEPGEKETVTPSVIQFGC